MQGNGMQCNRIWMQGSNDPNIPRMGSLSVQTFVHMGEICPIFDPFFIKCFHNWQSLFFWWPDQTSKLGFSSSKAQQGHFFCSPTSQNFPFIFPHNEWGIIQWSGLFLFSVFFWKALGQGGGWYNGPLFKGLKLRLHPEEKSAGFHSIKCPQYFKNMTMLSSPFFFFFPFSFLVFSIQFILNAALATPANTDPEGTVTCSKQRKEEDQQGTSLLGQDSSKQVCEHFFCLRCFLHTIFEVKGITLWSAFLISDKFYFTALQTAAMPH